MSDLDRLAADLGRAIGSEPLRSVELDDDPVRRSAQLSELRELLASAPAALASTRDADLADDGVPGGLGATELEREAEAAGLTVGWLGVMDGHGGVGRRAGLTALLEGTKGAEARELLAPGPLGLRFDPEVRGAGEGGKARVCIASYEFVGPTRTGGIGTAYTSLADALAEEGHEVVVLFSGGEEPGGDPFAHWAGQYRKRGIELHALAPGKPLARDLGLGHQVRALRVYEWLRDADRERPFDVIHFPEVLGHAVFAVEAKRLGLAFAGATLVLGTHSSTSWVLETNGTLLQARDNFVDDFCERRSVEEADVVVSPSAYMIDWMRSKGWVLPDRSFVQQYVRSGAVGELAASASGPDPLGGPGETELVFFGRLEPRKGLRVFCDALDALAERGGPPPSRVTFLGKASTIDGRPADDYVRERAEAWQWPVEVISHLNQPQAVAYLRAPGARLTVIPSLADNSPNTVYEALALRLRFIASRVGGTAELIDPRDLGAATFDPGRPEDERSRALGAGRLADRLADALGAEGLDPPRVAVEADVSRRAHVDWHAALAGRGGEGGATAKAAPLPVVIVGADPGLLARTRASLGDAAEVSEAPSHAEAGPGAGPTLYVDAGIELEPGAADLLAGALATSGDELAGLTVHPTAGGEIPRLPLGGPPLHGLFRRCFGDAAFVATGAAVAELGGFDAGVPADMQAHVLLARASLAGKRIASVPEPLARAQADALRPLELTDASRRVPALLEAYAQASPEVLAPLPLLSQQVWSTIGLYEEAYSHLYRYRFGRFSVQVRFFVHIYRQLQALWARVKLAVKRRP